MEKVVCESCGREIPEKAKRCTYCNTKPHSKVAIIILIILIFFTVIYPIYEWWYYKYYVTEKVRRDYSMNTPSIVYQIDEEV